MSEYNPDRWVIVKIKNKNETFYKVLGGWSGGYLDADSWRLSSGVEKIEEKGNYYLIHNYSGSIYKCHKQGVGTTGLSGGIYASMRDKAKDEGVEVSIISVEDYLKETQTI